MTFLTIVLRSLTRRKVRTGLTLVGISIGIAAVVALVGMAQGYEKSVENQLNTIGIDLVVSNMSEGIMPKLFDEAIEAKVAAVPNVREVTSVYMRMISVEEVPMMMVSGREWGGFTWNSLELKEGRLPNDANEKACVLGILAAESLKKKVGDTVQLEADEVKVVGIVDGHSVVENGAIFLSLSLLQELTGEQNRINFVDVRLAKDITKEQTNEVIAKVKEIFPEGKASPANEVVGNSQGFRVARAMSWSTSLLAIIVGILGVMNTMLMTVFERTHEIGILLAVGWRRVRIMSMILCESAMLGFFGGVFGVALGAIGLKIMERTPVVRGMLEPDTSPQLLLTSVAIAVVVGVISGLYPAWRSSRLSPAVALHAD